MSRKSIYSALYDEPIITETKPSSEKTENIHKQETNGTVINYMGTKEEKPQQHVEPVQVIIPTANLRRLTLREMRNDSSHNNQLANSLQSFVSIVNQDSSYLTGAHRFGLAINRTADLFGTLAAFYLFFFNQKVNKMHLFGVYVLFTISNSVLRSFLMKSIYFEKFNDMYFEDVQQMLQEKKSTFLKVRH